MKNCSMSGLVAYALFSTLLMFTAPASSRAAGLTMRADLIHVDSGRGFTRWELLTRMAARSRARAASLHQQHPRGGGGGGGGHKYGRPPVSAPVAPSSGEYLIHFSIGSPRPQRVALTMDTGSDLVWTQCAPCPVCFDQLFPVFDASASRAVACSDPICRSSDASACVMKSFQCFYLCSYADKSVTAGYIVRDTFTFTSPPNAGGGVPPVVAVPELAFGCGEYNTGVFSSNESGIAGFGRGALSLPSQLKVGSFSYCLTPIADGKPSAVFLGTPPPAADGLRRPFQFRSTPMIYNPANPTFYYLAFEGITVGETRLPVDRSVFALRKDGSGGTVIDSGTSYTTLPPAVFEVLEKEFAAQFPLPRHDDDDGTLCFRRPASGGNGKQAVMPPVPKLIFHLAGADMELPRENYVMDMEDTDGGAAMCLMIDGGEFDQVLIGNFQQQNMLIVYDVQNSKLLFAPAQCEKL